jgi:hypothetical protein
MAASSTGRMAVLIFSENFAPPFPEKKVKDRWLFYENSIWNIRTCYIGGNRDRCGRQLHLSNGPQPKIPSVHWN